MPVADIWMSESALTPVGVWRKVGMFSLLVFSRQHLHPLLGLGLRTLELAHAGTKLALECTPAQWLLSGLMEGALSLLREATNVSYRAPSPPSCHQALALPGLTSI